MFAIVGSMTDYMDPELVVAMDALGYRLDIGNDDDDIRFVLKAGGGIALTIEGARQKAGFTRWENPSDELRG